MNRAKFPGHARAGDRIRLDVKVLLSRPEGTLCEGIATVDGNAIAEAEFMIVLLPPELTPPPDPERDEHRRLLAKSLGIPVPTKEDA